MSTLSSPSSVIILALLGSLSIFVWRTVARMVKSFSGFSDGFM
jgi:hypothetical protein